MEDIVIVESRDYAQVVFECVADCYTESKPIECVFTLSQLFKVEPTDFIGIYKVGFTCLDDFVLRKPIQMELITKEKKGKLVFDGQLLPKEKQQDCEYYQFVYVSQGKLIRGASIPFQYKRCEVPRVPSVCGVELLRPKETKIIETIDELRNKCDKLSLTNESYVRLLKDNEHMIKLLKDEVANMKLEGLRMTMERMLTPIEKELSVLPEMVRIQSESKKQESLVAELTHTLKLVIAERNQLNTQIVSLKHENEELKSSKVTLTKEYTMTKEKLTVAQHSVETLKGQLVTITKKLEESTTCQKKYDELLVKMREQEKIHQQEKDHFMEIIRKMKEESKKELSGPYYALQVANTHLEKKIKQETTEQKVKIQELVEEVESLKDRLRQGAYEYTCLSRKYNKLMCLIEGSKIESEIKREFNELLAERIYEQPETIKMPTTKFITLNEFPSLIKYEQVTVPSCYREIPRSSSAHIQTIGGVQKSWEPTSSVSSSIQSVHTESHIPSSVYGQIRY